MTSKLDIKKTYEDYVSRIADRPLSKSSAMGRAIGGEFEAFGVVEREMLKYFGLAENGYLIDVGCGSGRLALPLAQWPGIRYLGTDVVTALVDHARSTVDRSDWTFKVVNSFDIPEMDGKADMVCFFSVLTHLLHEQSYIYLQEAKRVLRPGGLIVFSFLEFAMGFQWNVFEATVKDARESNSHPLNVFIERNALAAWAEHLGLEVVEMRNGDDTFVPLSEPVTLEDGRIMKDFGNLGQSIGVFRKPAIVERVV